MREKSKKNYYVCSGISYDGALINKIIDSNIRDEVEKLFLQEFNPKTYEILGPFFRKTKIDKKDIKTTVMKFSNITKKAIYNNWLVNAFILKEPKDYAYLVFIKHIDKNLPCPSKSITIPISELRFL